MPTLENQLSIESLITAPLVAASKANVVMVTGQTRALLENCFNKGEDGAYEPVMIRMSMTRGFVQPEASASDADFIKPVTLTFSVPLICLIPINNIVVNKVNVQFNMEITAVASKDQKSMLPGVSPVVDDKAVLLGKIARRPSRAKDQPRARGSSHLQVNIRAAPLPLPLGLLTVLDLYSKSVQPAGVNGSAAPAVSRTKA